VAYRQRAQGTDLADATALMAEEARTRAGRYGSCHPFTLVARSLHTRSLLVQAEATGDQEQRLALARQALDEVSEVRPVRDRLYGATSATATRSRRYEGHALFLLGDLTRARSCLEQALLFEATRHDNPEWAGWGHTHLLLARVYAALGDLDLALQHDSYWLLSQDVPAGPSCRAAAALLKELRNGRESRRQAITADRPTRP
jgi:tetratricopeptide (TPR) repeat protein